MKRVNYQSKNGERHTCHLQFLLIPVSRVLSRLLLNGLKTKVKQTGLFFYLIITQPLQAKPQRYSTWLTEKLSNEV